MKMEDIRRFFIAWRLAAGWPYALMDTREDALLELTKVFHMIADEYREKG